MNKQLVISKPEYEQLIQVGFLNGEIHFVSSLIDSWLASYPADLASELFLSKVLNLLGKQEEAIQKVTRILMRDPEFLEAYQLLSDIGGNVDEKAVKSFVFILGGTTQDISSIYPWAVTLRAVRMGLRRNNLENVSKLLNGLLLTESNNPLVALANCQYLIETQGPMNSLTTVQQYREKWSECLQFSILLADIKMRIGEESEAVHILHQCAASDPSGQVLRRVLGDNHDFQLLWDQNQSIQINIPVPSSVGVSLQWNRLESGGEQTRNVSNLEGTLNTEKLIDKKSIEQIISTKHSKGKLGKIPVYVILSTKTGLEKKFGKKTTQIIIEELLSLTKVVDKKKNWNAVMFLPDDQENLISHEIQPLNVIDPWKIKLALNDLDKYLKTQSRMIGSVIIIGGHEIVPFHKLPNPTDDSDDGVLSDNPYATSSGNYLIPEWSVGRLPDESGRDAGLLLEQIRQITTFHATALKNRSAINHLITMILDRTEIRRFIRDIFSPPKNFGYSAAVWRRSSISAFRPIGAGASLRITPPYQSENIDVENLMKSKCAYFNLHGLSNSPEWYGQRDFSEEQSGPDFPVAISTREIKKYRNNVDLTFSEACYGGYVINKKIDDSIALKLISIGSQGLVASTCIAYGSVFPPLIGADLLAFIFWKYIKEGYSFGESLMQAKIGLVKVMNQRQGYLDGEDQKTLESFVLFGDPLGNLEENIYLEKYPHIEKETPDSLMTFTDQNTAITNSPRLSKQAIAEINEVVGSYIPNLRNARIQVREHQLRFKKMIANSKMTDDAGEKQEFSHSETRTQVTYSQKLKSARLVHEQFARVTLDESGKVIKLAVSR